MGSFIIIKERLDFLNIYCLWIFQEVLRNFAICLMCSGWLVFIDSEYQVSLVLTYIFSST